MQIVMVASGGIAIQLNKTKNLLGGAGVGMYCYGIYKFVNPYGVNIARQNLTDEQMNLMSLG